MEKIKDQMHCPRCGQQQVSNEIKFCSRCGFQMGLVAEILANGGYLPQLAALENNNLGLFTRRNGVIFSISWFIFFLLILTPIFGIADIDELSAIFALFGIFGGAIFMLISLVVLKRPVPPQPTYYMPQPPQPAIPLYGNPVANAALPPQQSEPVSSYAPPGVSSWKTPETGEFVRTPPSVTDTTTKLLNKDKDQ